MIAGLESYLGNFDTLESGIGEGGRSIRMCYSSRRLLVGRSWMIPKSWKVGCWGRVYSQMDPPILCPTLCAPNLHKPENTAREGGYSPRLRSTRPLAPFLCGRLRLDGRVNDCGLRTG